MPNTKKRLINEVHLIGKLASFEANSINTKNGPALKVRGEVMVNTTKIQFDTFISQYNKDGSQRKNYNDFYSLASNAKSIASVGLEDADVVDVVGSIVPRDYVSRDGRLKTGFSIQGDFIYKVTGDYKPTATVAFEGFIKGSKPENQGLKVNVFGLNYRDAAVPFSFYVPSDLVDEYEVGYYDNQTAVFYIDIKSMTSAPKPAPGGIGVQRTTGRSRTEYVLAGASVAMSDDEPDAIPLEKMQEALAARKAYLKDLEEKGYRGKAASASANRPVGLGSVPQPNMNADDDELDF